MNYRVWSARGAICFAPIVIAQVVARNWGGWEEWPFWIDDVLAAMLLVVGGYLALDNDTTTNSRVLTGAWGFTIAGMWGSLSRTLLQPNLDSETPPWLLALMLASLLISVGGGAASLPSKRASTAPRPAKPATAKPKSRTKSRPKAA